MVIDNSAESASWLKDCNPGSFYWAIPTNFDVNHGKPLTRKVEQLGLLTVVNFIRENDIAAENIVYSKSEKSRKPEGISSDSSVPSWWPVASARDRFKHFQ